MKKILMLTSGHIPVPASKSGGVENLIDIFIEENEKFKECKLNVLSIYDEKARKMSENIDDTKFTYIKINFIIRMFNKISYFIAKNIFRKKNAISYYSLFTRLFYIYKASKYIRKYKNYYEYIIVENHPSSFLALKLFNNFKYFNGKILYHVHNEFYKNYGCKKIIEKSKIICVSNFIANSMLKKFDIPSSQVKVLKNCVRQFPYSSHFNLKNNYHIPEKNKIISFFGRIVPEKGVLQLIKSINNIKQNNFTLLIVGSSLFENSLLSDYEKEVRKECSKSYHQIIFTGYVEYNKISNYYSQSDVIVVPSMWNDPAPLTVIESIIYEKPLIATISGGIPEYTNNKSAILIKRDKYIVQRLANSIKYILDNPPLIYKMIKNTQILKRKYSLDNYYKEYNDYLKKK